MKEKWNEFVYRCKYEMSCSPYTLFNSKEMGLLDTIFMFSASNKPSKCQLKTIKFFVDRQSRIVLNSHSGKLFFLN